MFPTRNGVLHSDSSMANLYNFQQLQHVHQTGVSYDYYDDGSYNSISAFRNLTLSDINPTEEIRRPTNENRLEAAAAASSAVYLPLNLDDWPISGAQQNGNDRSLLYYPPMSPQVQPYIPQMYQSPNMFGSPNLASFPCNMQSPPAFSPGVGYQFPKNVTFQGLSSHYPQQIAVEENRVTPGLMGYILHNPFECMTSLKLYRPLMTLLAQYSKAKFIDEFIRAITMTEKSLVDAACNYPGTCVIQSLIKSAKKRPIIARVPQALAEDTVVLMTDQSGMHVIKQCFIELDSRKYVPLFEKIMERDNLLYIARDKHGCRGLNECLDYMVDTFKSLLLTRIALSARELATDIYGTYVLQHVIDLRTIHTEQIVNNIKSFIEVLITVKNGSHLLEKCLDTSYSSLIVEEIIKTNKVVRYALHECANYVIQKAINRSRGRDYALYEKLVKILSKERTTLQVNKHGKYVAKLLPGQ